MFVGSSLSVVGHAQRTSLQTCKHMFRSNVTAFPRGGILCVQGRALATARTPLGGMGAVSARGGSHRALFQYMPALHIHTKGLQEDEKPAAAAVVDVVRPGDMGLLGKKPYKEQIGIMFRKYRFVFLGTYFGIYFGALGGVLVCLGNDVNIAAWIGVNPIETVHTLCQNFDKFIGYDDYISGYMRESPNATKFAVAWAVVKPTEPFRLALSIVVTPFVAKALGWREGKLVAAAEAAEAEAESQKEAK